MLEVPNQQPRATHLKIPSAEKAFELCARLEKDSLTDVEFYTRHREEARKMLHMKKIRLSLKQKQEQKLQTLKQFAELIDKYLRTALSKKAFQLIIRLSIVHPTKRDGGIMNCFLTADTDELIVGQEAVLENCLRHLQKISGAAAQRDVHEIDFPTLPPLTRQQVQTE